MDKKSIITILIIILVLMMNVSAEETSFNDRESFVKINLTMSLEKYMLLNPVIYEDEGLIEIGFAPEDLSKISNSLFLRKNSNINETNTTVNTFITLETIIGANTYMLQKLYTELITWKTKVNELDNRIEVLEKMLEVGVLPTTVYDCINDFDVLIDTRECPGGLSSLNEYNLQTRCYKEISGWYVCDDGWVERR